jgi:hypothetical protein
VNCANVVRTSLLACLLSGSLLTLPALAAGVEIEFDPQADFTRLRQFQWRTHPVFEKNPQLQETYATGIQLVMEATNAQLMKRGLSIVDSSPDVFVSFYLQAEVGERVNGMLVLEMFDARTSKLLWRAYCHDRIKDMSKRDKNITAVVKKAVERFPPKQK